MLRHYITGCLLASAIVAVPALAQTSTSTGSPATQPRAPGGTSDVGTGTTAGAAGSNIGVGLNFLTQREPGVWRASELIGKEVRGSNNEDIGDVNDVLIGQNGQVRGVIVGVGGFLGLGETNVALPMQAFQFQNRDANRTAGTQQSGSAGTAATTGAGTAAGSAVGTAGQATTATTGAAGQPDAVLVLMVTKDQLQNAPRFNDGSRGAASNSGAAGSRPATGAGTAPRQ